MSGEKFMDIEGIGQVRFVRNRKARNLSIRISREGDVRVTVPGLTSMQVAEHFVRKKTKWISSARYRIEQKTGRRKIWQDGSVLEVYGRRIYIKKSDTNIVSYKVKRKETERVLLVPPDKRLEEDSIQEEIRNELWKELTRIGKEVLPERVKELSERSGLSYKEVKVRRMKSRWGSCSAGNNINLSTSLLLLPPHLSDYVILHELAHTVHKDHSVRFWKLLDRLSGDSAQLRAELRRSSSLL